MYNFFGIAYRIWGVCGVILLLGIVCILMKKPWLKTFKLRNCRVELFIIGFAVCLGLVYTSRILFPNISSYSGTFVESHRNSRVAPPLPVTNEYVFWNGEGKKPQFYLDVFSKKRMNLPDFQQGQEYKIYYDEFTHVIVKAEVIESTP